MRRFLPFILITCLAAACGQPVSGAPGPTPSVDAVPAQLAAIRALAAASGAPVDQIRVIQTERIDWPDGCLGLPASQAGCPSGVTPGFAIVLEVGGGGRHRFHTDLAGSRVIEAAGEVRLTWHRDGGLAGACDVLSVTTAGAAEAGPCNQPPRAGRLEAGELAELQGWAQTYGAVVVVIGDPGAPDSMLTTLEMDGRGAAQPDDAQQSRMLEWAQAIYGRLTQP